MCSHLLAHLWFRISERVCACTVWRPDDDTLNTLREGETFVVSNLTAPDFAERRAGTKAGADRLPASGAAVAPAPARGTGREGGPLELGAQRSRWLKARPGIGALCGLVSGYTPRLCVPLAALGASRFADYQRRVAEARRAAAVEVSWQGGGAEAINAAASAAAAAAAAPTIAADAHFDAVGILVHAAAVLPSGIRGQHQFGFFVDASLVQAATQSGAEADADAIDLVAITVRRPAPFFAFARF